MVLVDVPGRLGSEGPRRPWEEGPDPGLTLVITAARCGDEGTFGPSVCMCMVTVWVSSCRCDSDRKSNVCGCPSALQGLTAAQALASRVTWASHPLPGPSGDDGPGVKVLTISCCIFLLKLLQISFAAEASRPAEVDVRVLNKKFWTLTMYQPLPRLLLPSFSDSFVETDPIFKTIAYIRCFCEFGFHVQEGQWGGVCLCEEFFLLLRPLTDPFFESRPFYYNVSSALLYRTSQPENAFFFISSDVISTSRNGKKTGVLAFKANEAQRG
ncbi:hypothetical protein MJT46_001870 [Ovis ammon polii x Ovis aries]|nr:hypothetical protein MJT46_001870 [Ovis ammon polii x Ovis aries]